MNHISTRLIAFFCASACAVGATAQEGDTAKLKMAPRFGQLAPADIQAIQGVGRAVLAAKGAPDPSQEALRNDMKALGATLDQTLSATLLTLPVLKLGKGRTMSVVQNGAQTFQLAAPTHQSMNITGLDGTITQVEVPAMPVAAPISEAASPRPQNSFQATPAGKVHYGALRNQLAAVRQRTDLLTASPQPRGVTQSAHTADLLSKSKALNDELSVALDEASTNNATKLIKLRDRLRPKTLAQLLTEQKVARRRAGETIPEDTPTISVRTRHR